MVPEGWKCVPLGEIADVRTGVAKNKKELADPVELPYLRVANVQDGRLDLNEIKTIEIERRQVERYSLAEGDVLMTEGGDFDKLGRGDVWRGQISQCLHQNRIFAVRVDSDVLSPYFLSSLSGSSYGKDYFLSCAKRSTNLASINSSQLKKFPVILPSLPEQKRIAEIVAVWDKAISIAEKLVCNGSAQRNILISRLLENDSYGNIESLNYQKVALGDLAKINAFTEIPKTERSLLFVSMKDVSERGELLGFERRDSKTGAGCTRFINKDVLVAKITPCFENGKGACVSGLDDEVGFGSTEFIVLRALGGVDSRLIYHSTIGRKFRIQGERSMQGSAGQKRISPDFIRKYQLFFPSSICGQSKISNILDCAVDIERHSRKILKNIKEQRSTLIHNIIAGKLRVKLDKVA